MRALPTVLFHPGELTLTAGGADGRRAFLDHLLTRLDETYASTLAAYTRALASKIGSLGYKIKRVAKANRFDYPSTAVYFEPGGDAFGNRLARQLGVQAKPLPGGSNPRRLVVIAGPPRIG